MHHECGYAIRVAARLPVDEVAIRGVEHVSRIRLDRGIHLAASLTRAALAAALLAHADTTVTTVCPILILSPFFSRWGAWMRRPLREVPLVEPRSLTYQKPWASWKRAWWLEAYSSMTTSAPWRPAMNSVWKLWRLSPTWTR